MTAVKSIDVPFAIQEERVFGRSIYIRHSIKKSIRSFTSFECFCRTLAGFFPILQLLSHYQWKKDFLSDLMAGMTVGAVLVPQGLAYAFLSGTPAVNGLHSSLFSTFFYLVFGEIAHVSRGPSSVLGILSQISNDAIQVKARQQNMTADPTIVAATLTFTVGIIHMLMAILHFEFLSSFFSESLVSGFVCAAAVHTIVSQLPALFGVQARHFNGPCGLFLRLWDLLLAWPDFNWKVIAISTFTLILLLVAKIQFSKCFKLPVPYELIIMIVTAVLSLQFGWRKDITIVGEVPNGFPSPQLPAFNLLLDCLPHSFAISVVTLAMHLSMIKVFMRKYKYSVNPRQEIYAIGMSSFLSGFFPVFPTSTALARSTVLASSGVRTTLANGVTAIMILLVILFVGPLFEPLPQCILSVIIVVSLRTVLLKFNDPIKLWCTDKLDFTIWIVSFLSTLFTNVVTGLVVGILYSLITIVVRIQWPSWNYVFIPDNSCDVCIFHFDGPLVFANCEFFGAAVRKIIHAFDVKCQQRNVESSSELDRINVFVFDCSSLTQIDSMGVNAIYDGVENVQRIGLQVQFRNVHLTLLNAIDLKRLEELGVEVQLAPTCYN
ncbi:hypothetical protein M3Y94_00571200 [Aphelenchoides besseyi]|nr:hypothetical protein M3Y94_00571200 [Aphelenchoides besseyi]KAI6218093.1 Sulfate permease family protein 3 [Aphelenchoides besseyi]